MRRLVLLLALFASPAWSASFYISTTGSDSNACTNQTTDACASFPRCNVVMSAGDTCYALAGTYTVQPDWFGAGAKGGWRFYNGTGGTLGNPKTFRGMPGQTVIIKPASYFNTTQEGTITLTRDIQDYLTFSDFTFYGRFNFDESLDEMSDNVTLERIRFLCPGAAGTGNTVSIMTQAGNYDSDSDGTTNTSAPRTGLVIRNNYFDIDSTCPTGVYTYAAWPTETYLPDFMHLYATSGVVIENNDFRVTDPTKLLDRPSAPDLRMAIWLKGHAEYARIRYNYCNGTIGSCVAINMGKCETGGNTCRTAFPSETSTNGDNQAYQNISNMGGSIGWDSAYYFMEDKVYNNTIYRPVQHSGVVASAAAASYELRNDNEIYNNIVVSQAGDALGTNGSFLYWNVRAGTSDYICKNTFVDNNLYYPLQSGHTQNFYDSSAYIYETIANWRTHLSATGCNANSQETNSLTSDPLFVDPAGGDFHLQGGSPASGSGRGGVNMGAYITGSEAIGCTFHPSCYSYNAAEAPSTSGNPRRVDMRGVSFK
jgi:hypothetical protein